LRGQTDWGLGRYEQIAGQLLPAARVLVEHAAPRPHERVLDLGCGTGNAALLTAERGAHVTGVDPDRRLLDVAERNAALRQLPATFIVGEADFLPLADACTDVVLSVFGVIFSPSAPAAAAEISRVTAPSGRVVMSAWIPEGALSQVMRARGEAITAAIGASPAAAQFAWHSEDDLETLFAPYGFSVTVQQQSIAFTAPSATDFIDGELRDHPMWVLARAVLEPRGELDSVRDRALSILQAANESPDAFRVTSNYALVTLTRGAA